ncbi:MAG: RNA 2',3'-cyclic phosphodiesterase [Candidatus Omnitrophica bacterium]|nr:RNA 2',3'-cyclic phosphodiesterase [Candidatus Omnitrophota bacterium]
MKKVRSFIAIELSEQARLELARVADTLKSSGAAVKWVKPESVHLTLKFLGEVEEDRLVRVAEKLKDIAKGTSPFEFVLEKIGVFPKWEYAKVLWIGLAGGSDEVKEIVSRAERVLQKEGFDKEKRAYTPHLTLGRIRSAKRKKELRELTEKTRVNPVPSRVSRIILFKSELTPEGAVYTEMASAELAG